MVAGGPGRIHLEILPWLAEAFGQAGSAPLVLEEELTAAKPLGELLASLAAKYPAITTVVLDVPTRTLHDHVSIIHNGTVLPPGTAPSTRIAPGDSLIVLPAFSGG